MPASPSPAVRDATSIDELDRFRQIVILLRLSVVGMGTLLLLGWFVTGSPGDLQIALADVALAAWTYVPLRVVGRRGVSDAAALLAAGLLVVVALLAAVITYHPVLILAPLLAIVVTVPYIEFRLMRIVGLVAGLLTVAIVARAQFAPGPDVQTVLSSPVVSVLGVASAMAVGIFLTLQASERVRDMLELSRRSEEELRRTGGELLEQRDLLRSVIEGTTDHAYLKDASGRYLLMNESAIRWLDRPRDQIMGRTPFTPAVLLERIEAALRAHRASAVRPATAVGRRAAARSGAL